MTFNKIPYQNIKLYSAGKQATVTDDIHTMHEQLIRDWEKMEVLIVFNAGDSVVIC